MPDLGEWAAGQGPKELLPKESEHGNPVVAWKDVLAEEHDFLSFMEEHREKDHTSTSGKFALAFSGGGIRAAAFQSGVLWQLAKQNRLKDVTYFGAVSGGGYIASAFASHCNDRPPPRSGKEVKSWYLKVVADTIVRMQENAGNFVRDAHKNPGWPDEKTSPGAGPMPRILDLPVLLGALFLTMAVHPTMYVTIFLIPMTVVVELFFGPGMRGAFCYSGENSFQVIPQILVDHTPIRMFVLLVALTVSLSLVFSIVSIICCKHPKKNPKTLVREMPSCGYQVNHAMTSLFTRISVVLIMIGGVVALALSAEIWSYRTQAERQVYCSAYLEQIQNGAANASCIDYYRDVISGDSSAWWNFTEEEVVYPSSSEMNHLLQVANMSRVFPSSEDSNGDDSRQASNAWTIFGIVGAGLLAVSACLCIFLPCLGPGNIVILAAWMGPILVIASTVAVLQYAIFGPVTHNAHGGMGPYSQSTWNKMVVSCLMANIPLLIFYEELRSSLHHYYKRCIQKNFFHKGNDLRIGELAKDFYHRRSSEVDAYKSYNYPRLKEGGPITDGASYCPLLILTATSSDYQSPGDDDAISEVALTPLHTGGEETHYIRTPRSRSLAKCAALSGAGCLDAISLSMNNALYLRFWLEALNLSWGDYIIHATKAVRVSNMAENLFDKLPAFLWDWEDIFIRLIHRAPGGIVWLVSFCLLLRGWQYLQASGANNCDDASWYFKWVMGLTSFMVVSAFLSFLRFFDLFSLSSLSRLLLQLTKYTYVGKYPPRALYCTDGGVQDCTMLNQFMWRQCPKILMALAGADPLDELGVLRAAMDIAQKERLGSFFDPKNPKRDYKLLLEEYQAELLEGTQHGSVLHLRICYGYRDLQLNPLGKKDPLYGDLYIIKNRVVGDTPTAILPPITTDEVMNGTVSSEAASLFNKHNLSTTDLGAFGCCDCCHSCCNTGPKFPHGTFPGYLYLSPCWMSSLCRLGNHLSEDGLAKMDEEVA